MGDPDFVTCAGWLEAGDRCLGFQQVEVISALVLGSAHAAAIGCVKRFDAQCDFVLFHGATIAAFESRRIRFTSPHG